MRSLARQPTIAADNTVYIGSDDSKFYALSSTGTKLWELAGH